MVFTLALPFSALFSLFSAFRIQIGCVASLLICIKLSLSQLLKLTTLMKLTTLIKLIKLTTRRSQVRLGQKWRNVALNFKSVSVDR